MAAIEFTSSPAKTFILVIKDPLNAYATLATGISSTEVTPGRYRATYVGSGVVWIEATAGATKALGFADLDRPAANGSSDVVDVILNLSSSTGSGSNPLLITVGNGTSAIAGAIVSAKQSGNVVAWGYTNGAGQVTFLLASGTYSIEVQSQPGYAPHSPDAVTVPASSTLAITLSPQTLTPPTTPGLCTVRFFVLDNGVPVQGAIVYADLEEPNPMVDSALVSRVQHTGLTNSQGILDLVMIQKLAFTRGGIYRIRASDSLGRKLHDRRVTVPTLSTAYAEDLPDA